MCRFRSDLWEFFVSFWEDLLYFGEGREGREKVACRLLYSIFRVGRGLLYFSGCFWWCKKGLKRFELSVGYVKNNV